MDTIGFRMKAQKSAQPVLVATSEPEFFSTAVATARRFYLDLAPASRQALSVVCGGLEHCTPDYAVDRKTFPYYSIEYVAGGIGHLMLKGRPYNLKPGTVFSYGPGIPHSIAGDARTPLIKYFVDFSGKHAARLLRSCHLEPGSFTRVLPAHTLTALFDELILSGLSSSRGDTELCAKLLECISLKIAQASGPVTGTETLAFSTYQRCRQRIEQGFLKLSSLEQVATECQTDKAYLCRLFRRYDQQSPYQLLQRLKMKHAAERLRQAGILVKQAAEEVGFTDPFHFSRVFRRTLGVSPAAFRHLR